MKEPTKAYLVGDDRFPQTVKRGAILHGGDALVVVVFLRQAEEDAGQETRNLEPGHVFEKDASYSAVSPSFPAQLFAHTLLLLLPM